LNVEHYLDIGDWLAAVGEAALNCCSDWSAGGNGQVAAVDACRNQKEEKTRYENFAHGGRGLLL
jgi:hypothetical protein